MNSDYTEVSRRPAAFLIDIDGVIFAQKNRWQSGNHPINLNVETDLIESSRDQINACYTRGDRILLVTARPLAYRRETEAQLNKAGVLYHQLIMSLPTGKRILVNDRKPQESEVNTAIAINLTRDEGFGNIDLLEL
jgi:ribonucleotide monophosphatase NagD (HAD superfamily)